MFENVDSRSAASFTGQNQDAVPCSCDFLYREYSPVMGRWISPAVDRGHLEIWQSVEQAIEINNRLEDSTVRLSSVWATVDGETLLNYPGVRNVVFQMLF